MRKTLSGGFGIVSAAQRAREVRSIVLPETLINLQSLAQEKKELEGGSLRHCKTIEKLGSGFILKPEMGSTGQNYPCTYPGHYSPVNLDAPRHLFIDV
jgi:hypothetical protein